MNPFGGTDVILPVAYSFVNDYGPTMFSGSTQVYMTTLGARAQMGQTWQATLSESYGRQSLGINQYAQPDDGALSYYLADSSAATAFNPFGATNPRTLAAIERDFLLHAASTVEYTNLVADGSLFRMPAGDAKLAVGIERREEGLYHSVSDPANPAEDSIPQATPAISSRSFRSWYCPWWGTQPTRAPRPGWS